MSLFDDDEAEMTRHRLLHDDDVEAILGGRPVPDDLHHLARFVEEVREAATGGPPAPSATLAAVLRDGGATPARASRRTSAARSIAAKAAFASAVAVAVVGTGAAAGGLPSGVQSAVEAAVRTVTPFEVRGTPAPDEPVVLEDELEPEPVVDTTVPGPAEGQSFGEWVSEQAHADDGKPGVDGAVISAAARAKAKDEECPATTLPEAEPGAETETDASLPEGDEECDEEDGEGHGRPESPGQHGRDRAAQTPAATAPGLTGEYPGRGHGRGHSDGEDEAPSTSVAEEPADPSSLQGGGGPPSDRGRPGRGGDHGPGNGPGNGKGKGPGRP